MRSIFWFTVIFGLIVSLAFVLYYPCVYLTYTFTHDNLPDDNVRFYFHEDPGTPTEGSSGRFQFFWWLYATDALRILFPILSIMNLFLLIYSGPGLTPVIVVILAIILICEVVKFICTIIIWVPENCQNAQFCRNFGSRRTDAGVEIGEDPRDQNSVYNFMTWFNLVFLAVGLLYVVTVATMDGSLITSRRAQRADKKKTGTKPVASWKAWFLFVLNLLLTLALIVYLPLAFLNFSFADDNVTTAAVPLNLRVNLPDGAMPYYINDELADPTEGNSGRLQLYYWIYATDALLLLVPFLTTIPTASQKKPGRGFVIFLQVFVLLLFLWQLAKFVWAAVLGVPSLCEGHQFCRAFGARRDADGAEIGDSARNMNFVYSTLVWSNLVFVVLLLLELIAVSVLPGALFFRSAGRLLPGASAESKSKSKSTRPRSKPKPQPQESRKAPPGEPAASLPVAPAPATARLYQYRKGGETGRR